MKKKSKRKKKIVRGAGNYDKMVYDTMVSASRTSSDSVEKFQMRQKIDALEKELRDMKKQSLVNFVDSIARLNQALATVVGETGWR